jgi:hypothetical protein
VFWRDCRLNLAGNLLTTVPGLVMPIIWPLSLVCLSPMFGLAFFRHTTRMIVLGGSGGCALGSGSISAAWVCVCAGVTRIVAGTFEAMHVCACVGLVVVLGRVFVLGLGLGLGLGGHECSFVLIASSTTYFVPYWC